LFGLSCLAVGLFASSLSDNQMVATMVTFGLLLTLWVVGWMSEGMTGIGKEIISGLSLMGHLESFKKGILDAGDIVFYLTFIGLFILLTVRRLEWKRW